MIALSSAFFRIDQMVKSIFHEAKLKTLQMAVVGTCLRKAKNEA